jgi:hypothetical protein
MKSPRLVVPGVVLACLVLTACGSGEAVDPDTVPQPGAIAISGASLSVNQAAGAAVISVLRSGGAAGVATVTYATVNGTALAGADYTANSGTLTWNDGVAGSKSVSIPVSNATPFTGTRTFTLSISAATGATLGAPATATVTINGSSMGNGGANTVMIDKHILVDQFGYRPNDAKVAVIRNPQTGFDSSDRITPGTAYQLRRAADGAVVFSANISAWNGGATQASSGDQGWWFDFSSVTTPDTYFVYDVQRDRRSPVFAVAQQVYKPVLRAAMRVYFHQRSGFAKTAQYAGNWADGAAYVGAHQDLSARDVTDENNAAKRRDVSGGWFDAGDTNKYVTFATTPVHQLLMAYQNNPAAFTDDFNIPESGNGIPDVVDEVKFEIDWLKKMQFPDGSVALKVGARVFANASPPSLDATPRYYVPACTSSTIAAAGMFAHAAYVYGGFAALAGETTDLKVRALNAWNNYHGIASKQTNCDTGAVLAGDADLASDVQSALAVVAAIYLYAATGDPTYNDYVKANFNKPYMRPYQDIGWSRYFPEQGEALLFYTTLPNADTVTKNAIREDKQNDVNNNTSIYGFNTTDLYRAYLHDGQYHWGSNQPRANYGNSNVDAVKHNLAGTPGATSITTRAVEVLHYFHGVNPFGTAYLTNMGSLGATYSMNAIFHVWFKTDSPQWGDVRTSIFGPPPGYVPGGPNASTGATLAPPAGQPAQKSYRDWNGNPGNGDPQQSWEITEPGIYYQSAFVKLVSAFAQ